MPTGSRHEPWPLLYLDDATVLDPATYRDYRRIAENEMPLEEVQQGHAYNSEAGSWWFELELSTALDGETAPPEGHVGQYGRHGCVLCTFTSGMTGSARDVVLIPYEPDGLERVLAELRRAMRARFRRVAPDVFAHPTADGTTEVWAERALADLYEMGLHPLTVFLARNDIASLGRGAPDRGAPHEGEARGGEADREVPVDVHAAVAWGRAHAARLETEPTRAELSSCRTSTPSAWARRSAVSQRCSVSDFLPSPGVGGGAAWQSWKVISPACDPRKARTTPLPGLQQVLCCGSHGA